MGDGVAEEEAEEDGAADGEAVWSVVVSATVVSSEGILGSAGSVRAGGSDRRAGASLGSNAMDNAIPTTADTISVVSAHAGASMTISITRSHPRVRSLRGSHRTTANAHRSKANTINRAALCHQIIHKSYAIRASQGLSAPLSARLGTSGGRAGLCSVPSAALRAYAGGAPESPL